MRHVLHTLIASNLQSQSLLHQGIQCDRIAASRSGLRRMCALSPSQSLLHQGIQCDSLFLNYICIITSDHISANPHFFDFNLAYHLRNACRIFNTHNILRSPRTPRVFRVTWGSRIKAQKGGFEPRSSNRESRPIGRDHQTSFSGPDKQVPPRGKIGGIVRH
jgi:hypothetical protein